MHTKILGNTTTVKFTVDEDALNDSSVPVNP